MAAVEHTDGTASPYTVAPDGTELGFSAYFMTERQQLSRRASELLDAAEHRQRPLLAPALRHGTGAWLPAQASKVST